MRDRAITKTLVRSEAPVLMTAWVKNDLIW